MQTGPIEKHQIGKNQAIAQIINDSSGIKKQKIRVKLSRQVIEIKADRKEIY